MSERTFLFQQPIWRRAILPQLHPALVLISASLAWLVIYLGLGWRLWTNGGVLSDLAVAILAVLVVAGGVGLALGWWKYWRRVLHPRRAREWPPLSLDEMLRLSPSDFEAYVGQRLFTRKGYGVENTRDTKDNGIDLVVSDRNGEKAIIQCKRYRGTVGEEVVRDLFGTMVANRASFSYLITTGNISNEAEKWAAGKPIGLIDGLRLVELAHSE